MVWWGGGAYEPCERGDGAYLVERQASIVGRGVVDGLYEQRFLKDRCCTWRTL